MSSPREPLRGVVYPAADVVDHYARQGVPIDETLPRALMRSFAAHGERAALVGLDETMSYAALDRATDALALALAEMGLRPLDRAIFQMANSASLLVCVIGCWKAGVIPICTLASHREAEIGYLARHGGARAYFVQAGDARFDHVAFAQSMAARLPSIERIIVAGPHLAAGVHALSDLLRPGREDEASAHVERTVASLDPLQPVVFQLSGGTTGVPKIIPRLHFEYLYNMRSMFAWAGRDRDEVVFSAGPMTHNAGMVCHIGPALLNGGAVVTDGLLTADGLRKILSQHKPTWMFLPRPLLSRMKEAMVGADFDPSTVRGVVTAANARTVRDELGMTGLHIFGMAEGLIVTTRPGDPAAVLDECVGRPISPLDEVRIVAPGTMNDVRPGMVGELICRGPYTLQGYYDAPERNRDAFTPDGFYRSGDLLSERIVEGQRYLVFEGRLKDVINRGGEKINCDEVERAMRGFPGLIDVALVAMPDPDYGERGCAFVVMEPGAPALTVARCGQHLETLGLAKFKWPERIECVDAMPTTASAKISKPLLRQLISDMVKAERGDAALPGRPV